MKNYNHLLVLIQLKHPKYLILLQFEMERFNINLSQNLQYMYPQYFMILNQFMNLYYFMYPLLNYLQNQHKHLEKLHQITTKTK